MKTYNKLVRDKIPEIIKNSNKVCETKIVTKEEISELLKLKLDEEVAEFKEVENLEELADIMEVLFSLAKNIGCDEKALIELRNKKREERGGFEKGIVLINVK